MIRKNLEKVRFMFCLIIALVIALTSPYLWIYSNSNSYGETEKVLAEKNYYHLDMGIQLVYFNGTIWEDGFEYGDVRQIATNLKFNEEISVKEVYPLESVKGKTRFNFSLPETSHNIPRSYGGAEESYNLYYKDYVSNSIQVKSFGGSGNDVDFVYEATLKSQEALEVYEYGEMGRDSYIYSLFGGESKLMAQQPKIYESIKDALKQGLNGERENKRLYLIFCPNVIEYQKFIEVGEIKADIEIAENVKQGVPYTVKDISLIDDSVMVESALLEKKDEINPNQWIEVCTWFGDKPGENTKGTIEEVEDNVGEITYRLTVIGDAGQLDSVYKKILITDGREISGKAILKLQPETYEGHAAWAEDESEFEIDGIKYGAISGYASGIGNNSFSVSKGSNGNVERKNDYHAEVTFPERGNHFVTLKVDLINNLTLTDTKPILVKKTPTILDSLGGIQKQNRKQTLTAKIATYPGNPIVDYYIELIELETGENVRLNKNNTKDNSINFKMRDLNLYGGIENQDPYWTTFSLEFLTKTPQYNSNSNNIGKAFKYIIWAKDSKGDEDYVEKIFYVVPDMPPNVKIQVENKFLREASTNYANVQVQDKTTTDGDQVERYWTIDGKDAQEVEGYEDLSFGSKQEIKFRKEGVGKTNIQLLVKEKWTEPTLDEYIGQNDFKTGNSSEKTEVINIPPVVSLTPLNLDEAKIYILAKAEQVIELKKTTNEIKASLLKKGIYSDVSIVKRPKKDDEGYRQIFYKTWNSAMWCSQTCKEIGPIYDTEYMYYIKSDSIVNQNYSQVCNGTHTIYAESVEGNLKNWKYTVSQSNSFYIKLDNREKYVYVILRDKMQTIILDRETGSEVGLLPISLEGEIFISSKGDIYVADEESVRKYIKATNSLKWVSESGSLIRLIEGKISFVKRDLEGKDRNRFYIGQFDMETDLFSGKVLPEINVEDIVWKNGYKSEITPIDIDLSGKVLFVQYYIDNKKKDYQNASIWVADSKTQKIQKSLMAGSISSSLYKQKGLSAGFVRNSEGTGEYIYLSYYEDKNKTPTSVKWLFSLYKIDADKGSLTEVMNTYRNQNTRNFSSIYYAKIHEQENKIYVLRGNAFQSNNWGGTMSGERMTIDLTNLKRGADPSQWDIAEEYASDNGFLSATYYFYEEWINPENRVKILRNSITKDQAENFAINQRVSGKENENTFVIKDFYGNSGEISQLAEEIAFKIEEEKEGVKGLMLENQSGVYKISNLDEESRYSFEYEIITSPEAITSIFYPLKNTDNYNNNNEATYYKKTVAQIDFANTKSVEDNTYYSYSSSHYLKEKAGLGSGYYGKKGESKDYSFYVNMDMKKEGYFEFNMFNYEGFQSQSSWQILVDGKIYEEGEGSVENHKTIFLKAGVHKIEFQGKINSGYYGYLGVSNIRTVYYETSNNSNFTERTENTKGIKKNEGTFYTGIKPLFKLTSQRGENIETETFKGNKVNLSEYIAFDSDYSVDWIFNSIRKEASQTSEYYKAATGSFSVSAPIDKHLIVFFEEQIYLPKAPAYTGLTGKSKMIGDKVFFVEANKKMYRSYNLERGRDKGYGWVKIKNIRVIEIPAYVDPDSIFGKMGVAKLELNERKTDFNVISIPKVNESYYTWETFSNVNPNIDIFGDTLSLYLKNLPNQGFGIIKDFKLHKIVGNKKLIVIDERFDKIEQIIENKWAPINPLKEIKIGEIEYPKPTKQDLIYKKGQPVLFDINYSDYENDPSKKQYWRYYHTPMNDGFHPMAGYFSADGVEEIVSPILNKPIDRFYLDGKYTLLHWQEDNTTRKASPTDKDGFPVGNPLYDLTSNVEEITFYIESTAEAPWIKSIKTGIKRNVQGKELFESKKVEEGMEYGLQILVDDFEKDILNLTTEVYKNGKFIFKNFTKEITADNGNYPPVTIFNVGKGEEGEYQIVCTVRDQTGGGLGTYKFSVESINIEGKVNHTSGWNEKRKKFNLERPIVGDAETPRRYNVFWPGEAFELKLEAEGNPEYVTCEITDYLLNSGKPKYKVTLEKDKNTSFKNISIYRGLLWGEDMIREFSKIKEFPLNFKFIAHYKEEDREYPVQVLIDSSEPYHLLHRVW